MIHVIRKLGIIPNQMPFSFTSGIDRRTDSRIRRKNTAQPRQESNPGFCEGAALCFSSDPAVSSSIFVGGDREENLIASRYCFTGGLVDQLVLSIVPKTRVNEHSER